MSPTSSPAWSPLPWPTLRRYAGDRLLRLALPLGGIGTGTVSLGGRGELRDWEIMNRPAKGYSTVVPGNDAPFFALHARPVESATNSPAPDAPAPFTRALLGPLDETEYHHFEGRPVDHHGLPRFASAAFDAAYPFGQVTLDDPASPVAVRLQAFNPFVPGDLEASSLPLAALAYVVTNRSARPLAVSVLAALRNFIGRDGSELAPPNWKGERHPLGAAANRNTFVSASPLHGLFLTSDGVPADHPAAGSLALVTDAPAACVTHRENGAPLAWSGSVLDLWDDFAADGRLDPRPPSGEADPLAALCVRHELAPGESRAFTFTVVWHFPHRRSWPVYQFGHGKHTIGNHYTTLHPDAWAAAQALVPRLPALEAATLRFVETFLAADAPVALKEAALFNLSTLRSQTIFRDASGKFFAWEGVMDANGSCYGNCTHVWNYEQATAHLFGELARDMRDTEFAHATDDTGRMAFRVGLPLATRARAHPDTAADGQLGCIVKFYRDWQLSGDRAFLENHWPRVRAALAYAWTPGGWDADQDGVLEGSQHNTMDVNYHGPNPQMAFWYLAALRAGAALARAMEDAAFADKCDALAARGSAWIDAHLFNGDYYEHHVLAHGSSDLAARLAPDSPAYPPFQLGPGCLVDQLVGQTAATLAGLGPLASPGHLRRTIASVLENNWRDGFADHFNPMRSYALGDESGLVMASWPRGRLRVPFPYFAEVMTGFEYTAAVSCIQEGMTDDALRIVAAIRTRHDGRRRNPFSEPECGHHYGRALAAWNVLLAWTGFRYSAVEGVLTFGARPGRHFWSTGAAWGDFTLADRTATLRVLAGPLTATRLVIPTVGSAALPGQIPTDTTLTLVLS
jgi:uncharacterized protein (DUF608 family)